MPSSLQDVITTFTVSNTFWNIASHNITYSHIYPYPLILLFPCEHTFLPENSSYYFSNWNYNSKWTGIRVFSIAKSIKLSNCVKSLKLIFNIVDKFEFVSNSDIRIKSCITIPFGKSY